MSLHENHPDLRLYEYTVQKNRGAVMNKRLLPYDPWVYRIVVLILGLVALASLVGTIMLTIQDRSTPELLIALGSAAMGGLAGLLAPSPLNQ